MQLIKWFKKFGLGCKNLKYQERSARRPKTGFQGSTSNIEAISASNTLRVSGELGIWQSRMIHYIQDFGKKHPKLPNIAKTLE